MKKRIALLLVLLLCLPFVLTACDGEEKTERTHFILDENGDYGGTLDAELYGEGAPMNGEYDVYEDIYYAANDYYYVKSTNTRTIFPQVRPYQQTMQDSDGIACALMVFNYFGDESICNELALVNKYEELTSKTVYKNGTTPEGLKALFEAYGYTAQHNVYPYSSGASGQKAFSEWLEATLKEGKFVMVRYQDGINFRWHLIIGLDTMNFDSDSIVRDDVIIFADPCDDSDHMQDGYSVSALSRFYTWWLKQEIGNPTTSNKAECVVISPKSEVKFEKEETDSLLVYNTVPERHLLLNADGSYGGTLNKELYGTISEKDGKSGNVSIEHTDYGYYVYPDYYNMESTDTRRILTNYQAFEQTEASSCGICSVLSILNYYNYDFSTIHTNSHILNRQKLFDQGKHPTTSKGTAYNYWNSQKTATFGQVADNDNGRKQEALTLIYMNQDPAFNDGTKLFNDYGGVGAPKLKNVPTALGYEAIGTNGVNFGTYDAFLEFVKQNLALGQPIATGWCPVSGHWTTIIGIDDMGTNYIYDDVIIIADSHDISDHYQDGYNTYPATLFYGQWRNGGGTVFQQYVLITKK